MINRDPRCVHVANSPVQAELTASWLDENGIPAEVMDVNTLGGLDGLTPFSLSGVSARGIEIWVKNLDDMARARELIEQHEKMRADRQAALDKEGFLSVVCEDCGAMAHFPASARGAVESCPHCGSYIDVEPEDADGPLDYGSEEEVSEDDPAS